MGISEQFKQLLRSIGASALLQLLKWLLERVSDNPGPPPKE